MAPSISVRQRGVDLPTGAGARWSYSSWELRMSDLADFLLARIAEEERACQALLYARASTAEQLMSPGRLLLHCAARRHVIALHEIGRASCRERVEISVVAVS